VAVKEQDIKLLWGRSGNRCAICRCELSQDKANASASFPFGEQAHIIARNSDGPRGKSILSPKERDSYHNLLLLCPNHHRTIDQDPEDYPIEKLHMIKAEHELWVQRSLSESTDSRKLSRQVIYAHLIDLTVEFTRLSDWNSWTNRPLATFPRYIEVVEEIPKTPSQKIQKNKLRERGLSASTWDRESVGYRVRRR